MLGIKKLNGNCRVMRINLKKLLLISCLLNFSVTVNADTFSVEEIGTMARMGVKVAFAGESSPHVVTTNITPSQMIRAEMLDLSNLGLHKLPSWLTRFSRLRSLNLAGNKLVQNELEEVKSMKVLEVLNLNNNPLGKGQLTETFKFLPNLRSLYLSNTKDCYGRDDGNYLTIIECFGDFKVLRSLQKLNISANRLGTVDLASFSTIPLQELNLANSLYLRIKFADLPLLQKLSIQGNRSSLTLPSEFGDAFRMQQLRVLDYDADVKIPESLRRKLESWKIKL